jgi:endonuclease YncB( thermonuclease family)
MVKREIAFERDIFRVAAGGRIGQMDQMLRVATALAMILISGSATAETIAGRPRVVDGDTLSFGDAKVRLNGIDAPERHQACQNKAGAAYQCGKAATAALIGEIAGAVVECRGDERDRYQRLIATCWKGVEDLNQWMVLNGWAAAYKKYSTVYVSAEDAARLAKRGLWAGDFEMPWDWRKAH